MFLVTHNLDAISFLEPENDPGQSYDYRLELAAEDVYTFLCVWFLSFVIKFLKLISVLFLLLFSSFLLASYILLYIEVFFPVGGYLYCFQFCGG